ncbi:MAG TPA: glucose-1-phosphate thymidylyltransferase, partial [Acidimicrobiia bacterium]
MRALVLAGGSGTRLRPITYTSAKQLVPLANKPILFFGLEAIAAAGIHEVGIVVGDTELDIRAAVGDGSQFGLSVTYLRQDAPLGLAHAVLIARDFLGDEPFVMYLGDNLVVDGIKSFVDEFMHEQPCALVLLTKVDHPEQFGVAELGPAGDLVSLVEKPVSPPSDLALVGIYLFDARIHQAVRAIQPSARGELEITDAIQWLLDRGYAVRPHILESPWIDTGKLTDLLDANQIVLEGLTTSIEGVVDDASSLDGTVIVGPGAQVIASELRGPLVIGASTKVVRSVIGPSVSLGPDCEVVDATIEHSVVLEGARISQVDRIADSLIGRHANVAGSPSATSTYRLHIGDHS